MLTIIDMDRCREGAILAKWASLVLASLIPVMGAAQPAIVPILGLKLSKPNLPNPK